MNALEALRIIEDVKSTLNISGEKESLKAIEIAERALKDHWFINIEYTDREKLKQDILNLIKERYKGRAERNILTVSFIKCLLEEIINDFNNKPV